MADLHFELVTPEKLVRSEDVHMVVVPGTEGDFGVLAGHAPVMSTIRADAELAIYRTQSGEPVRVTKPEFFDSDEKRAAAIESYETFYSPRNRLD